MYWVQCSEAEEEGLSQHVCKQNRFLVNWRERVCLVFCV
jgi:hypothetical protein